MGYSLLVYLVPENQLARAVGGNDAAMFAEALEFCNARLACYDEQLHAPDPDADAENPDLAHADALREIFAGRYTPGVRGSRYGWALECLCDFLSPVDALAEIVPCAGRGHLDYVDRFLARGGVGLSFHNLLFRSPPAIAPIPQPDDWPCIGHWTADEIAAAIAPLDALLQKWPPDIADDDEAADSGDDDDDVEDDEDAGDDPYALDGARETLSETLTWLRAAAAAQPGGIIVGFYG